MNRLSPIPPIAGRLEALDCGVAIGWARCESPCAEPLVVELLCDGYPVVMDRAELTRPDRAEPCGFEIALPRTALLGGRWVTARIANTGFTLDGAVEIGGSRPSRRQQLLRGEVTGGASLRLSGWVRHQRHGESPPRILALEQDRVLAETVADRPAAPGAPTADSALGFRFWLPLSVADGKPHDIRVMAGPEELSGSPLRIAVWPAGPADLLERAGIGSAEAERLTVAATALRDQSARQPATVGFASYPAWARAFPPVEAAPLGPETPVTVLLYGNGADAVPLDPLADQAAALTVRRLPDGRLGAEAFPTDGMVAWLRAGDRLAPGALARLAGELRTARIAYSDCEQQIDGSWHPWFKPDWDPHRFLSQAYVFGLLAADARHLPDGAETVADLAVAALASAPAASIAHCPEVLYSQTAAREPGDPPIEARWIVDSLAHWHGSGDASLSPLLGRPWLRALDWPCPEPAPTVAVLVPTRDRRDLLARTLDGLLATDYPSLEITVLDNASTCPETVAYLASLPARGIAVLPCQGPFNFAALNNRGVAATRAPVLCLLNNDVEIVDPRWLRRMVGLLMQPDVGIVGAKLLWPNGMVQHAGVALGIHAGAEHIGVGWADEDPGYCGAGLVTRQVSAVTAACLAIRREDYCAVGGMDEAAFHVAFNDVDLCLKMRARGRAVVWSPSVQLIHHESASRGADDLPQKAARLRRELAGLRRRWTSEIACDPFYNPNLGAEGAPFEALALPPRRPWR